MLDYRIVNAKIADGAGEKPETAVGIEGGRIACLALDGQSLPPAKMTIDAGGALLVPGIIDVHTHSDSNRSCAEKLLAQGVTSCVSGNCGLSPQTDFAAFRAHLEKHPYPINQAEQIGHSSLRAACGINDFYAAATQPQLEQMRSLVRRAFEHGAAGLSFGLEYDPGAPDAEVQALAAEAVSAARAAGRAPLISIHARNVERENNNSILEAVRLAETGARVIVSHLVYMWNGDSLKRTLDVLAGARDRGLDVWADSGMWTAYATTAGSAVFDEAEFTRKGYDFSRVRAGSGVYAGRFLTMEQYREVRRDSPKDCFIYDPGSPSDIWRAFSLDDVMVSSDAAPSAAGQGHPQNAATFPYFFRVLVKGGALRTDGKPEAAPERMSLREALRRTSLVPAQVLGLNKGRIAPGMDADIAVFDWEALREQADFPGTGDPNAPPVGVLHVFVNGALAIHAGARVPGASAGRAFP
ncbi:MAG: amidohydrolase family protein [Spirochaetaceae bacterium]|jgi:N-acyl-D-amino-acid deacylase|nr:amidohydrolase family protein [Spirochaetaceae bacterium]